MGWLTGIVSNGRRRLGRAIHDAGGATRTDISPLQSELVRLRAEMAAFAGAMEGITGRLATVKARLDTTEAQVDRLDRAAAEGHEAWVAAQNALAIDALSRFLRCVGLRSTPLVSVILPTYNRPQTLRRAIDSVIAQRYRNWELIVADDGGESDSRSIAEQAGDPRITWMGLEHRGVGAARNSALAQARGEIIAYLDDDNVMDPDWLWSVAWALDQRPEFDVLYGAFVVDDLLRVAGDSSGHFPRTFLNPWSREALRINNLADMGAIAHRSGLPEARFDESLVQLADWDLLVRLTADRDPLVLPAVACHYMTDAPNRLTLGPWAAADSAIVRARAAALGP